MHQLKILSIEDIIAYRLCHENLISEETVAQLPLEKYGLFNVSIIKEKFNHHEHIILTSHNKFKKSSLVRIHSACTTGDLFSSQRCDCKSQLNYSLQKISEQGGMLIYLNQEGRGIGLFNKIKAYSLQENGLDTVEANKMLNLPIDSREYYIAANILKSRNMNKIRLLTNNPLKVAGLKKYGISNVKMEVMPVFSHENNINYLRTKKEKLNHVINELL